MKKITETNLAKIINKVLNEQEDRQFNEDEIDLLHFIFERELKPPFRKGEVHSSGWTSYFNRDNEYIGWNESVNYFGVRSPLLSNIEHKVCQVFEFSYDTMEWWNAIVPHLKSWMEDQINTKFNNIR